jgi:asparagine synthase (glutamine-hydrolysing)
MHHRGPDSEGYLVDEGVALGMRRLAIIDLLTGDQPTFNSDRSVAVVLNGEIYNYREVRADLEKRGHRFRTESDTEVLPHLYDEYGRDMVQHLNGMFAFALWDEKRKRLFIARDRFGEKPLYWGVFEGRLLFASEPKVLLAHPSVKPNLNLNALRQYLSFDYVPAPLSIYEGINKLPAAHTLTLEHEQIKVERYWRLSYQTRQPVPSVDEAAAQLRDLLADSVKMRLVSDVPLGILLSGGIDSSIVAALAVRAASETVKTFSIGFAEASFDESQYARAVAKFLGTDHHEERFSASLAANLVGEIGAWMDEPISDPSLVPTYLLSRFTRKHVTVALGGDGGDEIFAGYPMYFGHYMARAYLAFPGFLRRGLVEPVVNLLPVKTKNLSFDYRARRFIAASHYDEVARHHVLFGSFAPHDQDLLLTEDAKRASEPDIFADARRLFAECDSNNIVERMQSLDAQFYLAEDILTKVDRASMAHGLEARPPMLDHEFVAWSFSLPSHLKLRGGKSKYLLKRAAEDLLPAEIIHRRKKGFGIPLARWLRGPLRARVEAAVEATGHHPGMGDPAVYGRWMNEHFELKADRSKPLWALVVLDHWMRKERISVVSQAA